MNFEERKATAVRIVVGYLDSYSPPRGLDDQQQAHRINSIADAFARKMPVSGDYANSVRSVLTRVSDTHLSNSWPPQAAFVMAMPSRDAMGRPAAQSFRVDDPVGHYASLMRAGEAVPEPVIWGVMASQLPQHLVERYRNASVMTWVDLYGGRAPVQMQYQYGHAVREYFPEVGDAR